MDKIKNREDSGVSVHGNRVNNLRFADDIDIIEQSNEKLQDTVDKLQSESERYGMHINVVMTKIMAGAVPSLYESAYRCQKSNGAFRYIHIICRLLHAFHLIAS